MGTFFLREQKQQAELGDTAQFGLLFLFPQKGKLICR